LVVTVPPEQFGGADVFAGVRLQQGYEKRAFELGRGEYRCPTQRASDFLAGRVSHGLPETSYPRRGGSAGLGEVLPPLGAGAAGAGRCGGAWGGWTAAGTAGSCRRRCWSAPRPAAARRCGSSATAARASRRPSPACTRSARGPVTPAASSAPPWTGCAPPG